MMDIVRISASTPPAPGIRTASTVAKLIDTTTCIGCKACEVACQEWNDLEPEPIRYQLLALPRDLLGGGGAREHDVAALEIRPDVVEPRVLERLAKLRHRDPVARESLDVCCGAHERPRVGESLVERHRRPDRPRTIEALVAERLAKGVRVPFVASIGNRIDRRADRLP